MKILIDKKIYKMNKLFLFVAVLFLAACSGGKVAGNYGKPFTVNNPVSADQLSGLLSGLPVAEAQVKGVVKEVCQHKGCWMTFATADGSVIYINAKDEGFTLPKNASGFTAVAAGRVLSVAEQKKRAAAAGEDTTEISGISFEADGIMIEEKK